MEREQISSVYMGKNYDWDLLCHLTQESAVILDSKNIKELLSDVIE